MDGARITGESKRLGRYGYPNKKDEEKCMAQNHYVTKTKRRNKSGKRKDPSAATMAKLRQLAAAEAKSTGK